MRKPALILLLILIRTSSTYAQISSADSLKRLLKNEMQDSTRVLLFNQISDAYQYPEPDSSMIYAQKELVLATQIKFTKGEADALVAIGNIFNSWGNNDKALAIFFESLRKAESINNNKIIGHAFSDIAIIYLDLGDLDKAIKYFIEAKSIATETHDPHRLLTSYTNLGDAYEKMNRLDSARLYTEQAYELAVQQHDKEITGAVLNNLGNIYSKMNQPAVAMDNYRMSLPDYSETGEKDGLCESTLGMAKLFEQQNEQDSCLYYAKLSFNIAKKEGFTLRVLNASNFLADYYKKNKVVDSAYKYLSSVITAKDSLFSQEKTREIQSLSFDETMHEQEQAAVKAEEEKERARNIEYAFISVGLICFIVIFMLLTQSTVVSERWIRFLGVLGLLLVFEFIDLFIHPYLAGFTNESPALMLLILVIIAAVLIPLHHRLEKWVVEKMVMKNKKRRLESAHKTIEQLENELK